MQGLIGGTKKDSHYLNRQPITPLVDDQLKTLIALCEEEKARLQILIDEYLKEEEYLLAHYHSNALYDLNKKLRILHNFDDELYDNKESLINKIRYYERLKNESDLEELKSFFFEKYLEAKVKIEKLNQTPKINTSETPAILADIFRKLLDKQVKNVKLTISKKNNLFLAFNYSAKELKITIPYIKQHVSKYILDDEQLAILQNLGFVSSSSGSKLTCIISGSKDQIMDRLNFVLCKIVFDLFNFKEFENESYIQYSVRSK